MEFEPAVRTEDTPQARIISIDLPGFRREDLRVQVNNRGNLIISGERGGQIIKVGGRLEKPQSEGRSFRKVITVPDNVNSEEITAKLKDQVLRVSLPFNIQKHQTSLHVADLSAQSKPDERSSPVKQQGLMQERPVAAAAQKDQSARLPEVIRSDDYKAKAGAAAEETKGRLEEKKTEAPKQAHDFVQGEPPISTPTQAVSAEPGSDPYHKLKLRKKDDKTPDDQFPETRIQTLSSTRRSLISNRGVFIAASAVLVFCAGMYFSYILMSRKAD